MKDFWKGTLKSALQFAKEASLPFLIYWSTKQLVIYKIPSFLGLCFGIFNLTCFWLFVRNLAKEVVNENMYQTEREKG